MFVVDLTLLGSFQFEHPSVGSTTSHDNRNLWSCKQTLLWLVTKQMKPYHASPLWFDAQIKVHGTLAVAFFSPIMAARWPLFSSSNSCMHGPCMHLSAAAFSLKIGTLHSHYTSAAWCCPGFRWYLADHLPANPANIYPVRPKGSDGSMFIAQLMIYDVKQTACM